MMKWNWASKNSKNIKREEHTNTQNYHYKTTLYLGYKDIKYIIFDTARTVIVQNLITNGFIKDNNI